LIASLEGFLLLCWLELLGSRLAMSELVATNHDCDQTCDLRNRAGEERLHCGESGIERRLRQRERRKKDEQSDEG
jgi:hypothetical protein